uniref:Uncharacterized protein n=1 Tax=Cucumis melo TaxID=3656 RepID=A0A9I9DID2_CUCME
MEARELSQGRNSFKRGSLREVVRRSRRRTKLCLYTSRYLLQQAMFNSVERKGLLRIALGLGC